MKGIRTQRTLLKRQARGFSLLEMIAVLGIIALLLGLAAVAVAGAGDSAKITAAQGQLQTLEGKLMSYKRIGNTYPSQAQGLEALVTRPSSAPKPRQWAQELPTVPLDPWDKKYEYKFPGGVDARIPEVISAGPDGQFNTEDDISSQQER